MYKTQKAERSKEKASGAPPQGLTIKMWPAALWGSSPGNCVRQAFTSDLSVEPSGIALFVG